MVSELLAGVTPPLDGKQMRWSVGTRPAPLSDWLSVDQSRHETMIAKDAVLRNHRDNAVITVAAGLEAADALLATTLAHLAQWHTGAFTVGVDDVTDAQSGRVTPIDRAQPLETLARILPQDFCLLTPTDESWRLTAAAVCFTSRWNLADKMGSTLSEIHAPVPGYEARVGFAVEHVIGRLSDDQVLKRSNWTLLDTDDLYLPEPAERSATTTDASELEWLRIEHQSLHRLRGTDAVVFTIDTRIHRVDDLESTDRLALHAAVANAPDDIARYKGWPAVGKH